MGIAHINEPHFLLSIKHTISLTSREKITPAIEKNDQQVANTRINS